MSARLRISQVSMSAYTRTFISPRLTTKTSRPLAALPSGETPPCALLVEDAAELGDVVNGEVGTEPLEERSVVDGGALRALMEHQHVGLVEGGPGLSLGAPGSLPRSSGETIKAMSCVLRPST